MQAVVLEEWSGPLAVPAVDEPEPTLVADGCAAADVTWCLSLDEVPGDHRGLRNGETSGMVVVEPG